MHKLSQQAYLQKLQTKISTGVLPQGEEIRTRHIRDTESMPLDESQKERTIDTSGDYTGKTSPKGVSIPSL